MVKHNAPAGAMAALHAAYAEWAQVAAVQAETATRESVPVTWSNQPIQLLGTVSDGVLTVSDTVRS